MPKITEEAKNERINILLDHAFKLFSKKGYSNTTVDDIVKSSGISKGGIYTYFRGKQDIFIAIAEKRFNERRSMVDRIPKEISSREKIETYLNWIIQWVSQEENHLQIKFTFEFWSVSSREKDLLKISKDRYDRVAGDLRNILKEGIERGEFKEDIDVESVIYIILSSTDGIGFVTGVMGVKGNESLAITLAQMILNSILK